MKTVAVYLFIFLWLVTAPAYGDNATEYFNLGVKNSATHKKIEYFTKALDLNPDWAEAGLAPLLPGELRQSNLGLPHLP